jgi:hypothetical protein
MAEMDAYNGDTSMRFAVGRSTAGKDCRDGSLDVNFEEGNLVSQETKVDHLTTPPMSKRVSTRPHISES